MIRHYVKRENPEVIEEFDFNQLYFRDKCEPGLLEKFKSEYMEVFDERYFSNISGSRRVLILENDIEITEDLRMLAERITGKKEEEKGRNDSNKWFKATNLHPDLLLKIYKEQYKPYIHAIHNPSPNNILIDSLFKDRKQFNWIVKNFLFKTRIGAPLTYFIHSHGTLLDVLNEENQKEESYAYEEAIENNLVKENPHWNYLRKLADLNRIYDIFGDHISLIHYNYGLKKFEVKETYYWKKIDKIKHIEEPKEKSSKWE